MYYLAIQNNYEEVQLALMQDATAALTDSINKHQASKELIMRIDNVLMQADIKHSDLSFIVANYGPGPFTTLRVVITTVNGIAYATHIPLIGINALTAAAAEWRDPAYPYNAILFNAFGNDVYALVTHHDKTILYGVYPIETVLQQLTAPPEATIRFLGNGATLHRSLVTETFGDRAYIPEPIPAYCSLKQIAHEGYTAWQTGTQTEQQLMPLYLKRHPATI